MELSEHEKQLTELEEKIDRLRGLYEQYFMGIERLEPLIPRKDVDRRITQLRKEQLRNTALRFRFNTLCQRFNTMQQHWGRIVREIENGTYRRDVARAAARFGVDEALTAVGRKRARGLQKVLEAQRETEAHRQARRKESSEYEAVEAADLIDDDDDDAPTPPPLARWAGARPLPADDHDAARFSAVPPAATAASGGFAPPSAAPNPGADPAAMGFPDVAVAPRPASGAPAAAADGSRKAPAGLRLGGGGSRRPADPDAARRRLEELAARMGEPMEGSPAPAERPRRRFDPDEIMSVGVPSSRPPPPPEARSERPSAEAARGRPPAFRPPEPAIAPTEPGTDSSPRAAPLGLRRPSGRASSPFLDDHAAAAAAPSLAPPGAARPGAAPAGPPPPSAPGGSSAADRAAAKRADVAAHAAGRGDLAEPRVREIYNQLIEAKRRSNESTASITYDKLADSLRKQVDRLKTEHKDRHIDFAVVTRDGKTMIKPVIK